MEWFRAPCMWLKGVQGQEHDSRLMALSAFRALRAARALRTLHSAPSRPGCITLTLRARCVYAAGGPLVNDIITRCVYSAGGSFVNDMFTRHARAASALSVHLTGVAGGVGGAGGWRGGQGVDSSKWAPGPDSLTIALDRKTCRLMSAEENLARFQQLVCRSAGACLLHPTADSLCVAR